MSEVQDQASKRGNRISRLFKSIRGKKDSGATSSSTPAQGKDAVSTGAAPAATTSAPPAAAPGAQSAAAASDANPATSQDDSQALTQPAPVDQLSEQQAIATNGGVTAQGGDQQTLNIEATGTALPIKLRNHTNSNSVFAYITGTDVLRGALAILQADGRTLYYPQSPSSPGQPLAVDCAIALPGPKQTRNVTLPTYLAGARLWFGIGSRLTFRLNPGPGLVEPSVLNSADPNININWTFCEFTYTAAQLFANISYVDFYSVPIGLTLYNKTGGATHISGANENGLNTIASRLRQQQSADGAPWSNLIVNGPNGQPLRVLSPNSAISVNNSLFQNYYTNYVNQVWSKYTNQNLTINTQAGYGNVSGHVQNDRLYFGNVSFPKPSSHDIFSCSTGPFAVTQPTTAQIAIIPRLAAAFNRSTLLFDTTQPNQAAENQFYSTNPTNHYSRIVHSVNLDKKGYAFPYDDVTRDGGIDQSGAVFGQARLWIVAVGGISAGTGNAPEDDAVAARF